MTKSYFRLMPGKKALSERVQERPGEEKLRTASSFSSPVASFSSPISLLPWGDREGRSEAKTGFCVVFKTRESA